ncbi:uncharacterized protein BJX67DRAFT_348925 [Aspergillus lucknowensis]|uniref:Uncharacterized protein n=1 Tax=Aspergillus lucknowensis TaxID=176173 RepID=A0ABR4M0K8_9EURO
MCYYNQKNHACGDFRWSNFVKHCNNEYRTGDTCGLRLVYGTEERGDAMPIMRKDCRQVSTASSRDRESESMEARGQYANCIKVSFSCSGLSLSASTLCRSHSRSFTVLRHTLWFSRVSVESSSACQ